MTRTVDVDELRAWLADGMAPWELTSRPEDPGWHEVAIDDAFVYAGEDDVEGVRRLDALVARLAASAAIAEVVRQDREQVLVRAADGAGVAAIQAAVADAALAALGDPPAATAAQAAAGEGAERVDAPVSSFEAMGRREARGLMARYLERHDDRRAWLDRRIGETLTPDAASLRRLWTWWIAWRATDARHHEPAQRPEWFAHILPGWSQWTTGPEVELVDAASFLLADALMAADPTLHWELELRKSSIWVHEPVLLGRGFRDINPRHFLLSSARTLGIRLDTPEHDEAQSWVAEPDMLVGCLAWGFRPLPREPGDGPFDLELHPESVILVLDDDSGLDIKDVQRRIAKLDGVDSTERDRSGRVYASVPYRGDPAALARAIRAELRG